MKNILNKIYGVFMATCTYVFLTVFWLVSIPNILLNMDIAFGTVVCGMMLIGMFCSVRQTIGAFKK